MVDQGQIPVEFGDVTAHIRDKVRAVIVASVPDEAMDRMIRAEYSRFFKEGERRVGHSDKSPFANLVEDELSAVFKERVKVWIGENTERVWGEDGSEEMLLGKAVEALIPAVQRATIMDITSRTLLAIQNRY